MKCLLRLPPPFAVVVHPANGHGRIPVFPGALRDGLRGSTGPETAGGSAGTPGYWGRGGGMDPCSVGLRLGCGDGGGGAGAGGWYSSALSSSLARSSPVLSSSVVPGAGYRGTIGACCAAFLQGREEAAGGGYREAWVGRASSSIASSTVGLGGGRGGGPMLPTCAGCLPGEGATGRGETGGGTTGSGAEAWMG